MLRQDEALEPSPAAEALRAAQTRVAETSERHASDAASRDAVVGREQQLDQLRAGLNSAIAGQPVLFMVGGEAGIGKTRPGRVRAGGAESRRACVMGTLLGGGRSSRVLAVGPGAATSASGS